MHFPNSGMYSHVSVSFVLCGAPADFRTVYGESHNEVLSFMFRQPRAPYRGESVRAPFSFTKFMAGNIFKESSTEYILWTRLNLLQNKQLNTWEVWPNAKQNIIKFSLAKGHKLDQRDQFTRHDTNDRVKPNRKPD